MPLEQLSNHLDFFSYFIASKVGCGGLTVTVDVWKHLTSTNASSQIITAGSATEVGGGLYRYQLSSASVTGEGEYICIFKTSSDTPDQKEIPSIWCVQKSGSEYLDAAVTSRGSASDVVAIKTPVVAYLDAGVSSRLAPAGITSLQADVTAITVNTSPGNSAIYSKVADAIYYATDARDKALLNYQVLYGVTTPAGSVSANLNAIKSTVDTNLNATISSRLAPAGITSLQADVTAIKTPVVANIDATISSRLPTSSYSAPSSITSLQADVTSIKSTVDTNLNATVSSRLAASAYQTAVGQGAISYTATLYQPGTTTPIVGAEIWVTSNSTGTTVVAGTLSTNSSGQATFMLDAGSYYLWVQAAGWNFTNPQAFVVS